MRDNVSRNEAIRNGSLGKKFTVDFNFCLTSGRPEMKKSFAGLSARSSTRLRTSAPASN